MALTDKLTAIADKIRSFTGKSEKLSLDEMGESIGDVYAAGEDNQLQSFWDSYISTSDGIHMFGGGGWTNDTFKPTKNITIKDNYMSFRYSRIEGDLPAILDDLGIEMTIKGNWQYTFYDTYFTRIGVCDLAGKANTSAVFGSSKKLLTIDKIICNANTSFSNMFSGCIALENVTFEGVIAKNGLSVAACTELTHDSLMSIINCLQDKSADTSGTTWTVTLGSTNIAKLTTEEQNIAELKGWNLA